MFMLNRRRLLLTALLAGVLGGAPMTTYADAGGHGMGSGGRSSPGSTVVLVDEDRGPLTGSGGRTGLTLLDEDRGGYMGSGG